MTLRASAIAPLELMRRIPRRFAFESAVGTLVFERCLKGGGTRWKHFWMQGE
jgi:hypothetical protein